MLDGVEISKLSLGRRAFVKLVRKIKDIIYDNF